MPKDTPTDKLARLTHEEVTAIRTELDDGFTSVHREMDQGFKDVRAEMATKQDIKDAVAEFKSFTRTLYAVELSEFRSRLERVERKVGIGNP